MPSKSKSKCMYVVGNKRNLEKPAPLALCGRFLPWVDKVEHLGNILTSQGNMEQDAAVKRAKLITTSTEIRELFKFAAPSEVLKALKIYCNSFYGSSLWDLGGQKAKQVFNTWNISVKLVWGCPQWTRLYFVQKTHSFGMISAKVEILTRYLGFFSSLRSSASHEVQVLSSFLTREI